MLTSPPTPFGNSSPHQEGDRGSHGGTLPFTVKATAHERDSLQTASDKSAETGTKTQTFELRLLGSKVMTLEQVAESLPTIQAALENIQHRLDVMDVINRCQHEKTGQGEKFARKSPRALKHQNQVTKK